MVIGGLEGGGGGGGGDGGSTGIGVMEGARSGIRVSGGGGGGGGVAVSLDEIGGRKRNDVDSVGESEG